MHELIRTNGRGSLTVSLAGCAFGLVVLASGMFGAAAASYDTGDAALAVAVGTPALGLLADTLLPVAHEHEWSIPAGALLGVVLGMILGATSDGAWPELLITGLVAGLVGASIRRGLRQLESLDPAGRLGYGIRALIRIGRAEYARVVKLIQQTPECINAYNVTGEDSWVLEIAVIDVAHLDSVVSKFCMLTETATSIILNPAREHQPMLPPRREDVKPPIRKVTHA